MIVDDSWNKQLSSTIHPSCEFDDPFPEGDPYPAMDHIRGFIALQAVKPDDESGSARFEASEALCAEIHVTSEFENS